jgi:hypothetical protein
LIWCVSNRPAKEKEQKIPLEKTTPPPKKHPPPPPGGGGGGGPPFFIKPAPAY